MLLIGSDVTAQVLRMPDVLRVLQRAYRDLAEGTRSAGPGSTWLPRRRRPAVLPVTSGDHAIRMKSDVLTELEYGGTRTQEEYCVEPGNCCGLVLLGRTPRT